MSAERDPFHFRIKAAQRELIAACGGIERAAALAGVSATQMGRLNAVGEADLMSLRVKARLEAAAGEPIVSRIEIEALGWTCAPGQARPDCGEMAGHTAQAAEVMTAHAVAMADGRVTPAEADTLGRALAELARAVETARLAGAALQAQAGRRA